MEITYEGEGERIDKWLPEKFSYSRNFFHHIIERGGITVNGKETKKSYKLRNNDLITIDNIERYLSPLILDECPEIEIPIVHEEEDYLVLNKPKGVLSHPNSIWDLKTPSVVGFLYQHFKDLPTYNNFIRAGLIHRLDKDTDGLLIIAKTEKGLAHFKQLFQAKSESETVEEKEAAPLQKFYRATCEVTTQGAEFLKQIENNLPYYIQEEVIAKVPNTTPKMGITKIEKIEKVWSFVKVYLQILTGRTHQIRYHLSHHGLPIVGDYLYGKEDRLPMQLTAYKVIFQNPQGEMISLEI